MKRKLACVLAMAMLLAACRGPSKTTDGIGDLDLSQYPIETEETLTYFKGLSVNVSSSVENYADTEFAKELAKRTGVKIEYVHPAVGQETEKLNLLISSGRLPDIIETNWINFSGGPAKAIKDQIIVPLNDYKEYAPGFFNVLKVNENYDKASKTDDGDYYGFTFINGGNRLLLACGPTVRKDLLEKYNLQEPETVEDWEKVLTVFKENGMKAPFSFEYPMICYLFNMFGASYDPIVKDGKVVYGPAQPEFKEALKIVRDWFKKGLLDQNIISVDNKLISSQILNDETGATITSGGGGIGQLMKAGVAKNPDFELIGVRYPTFERGKVNTTLPLAYEISGAYTAAVTTKCKSPELAVKFLDYLYTDEGHMLANFGKEGVAHTLVDGEPKYTDLILNNPDGKTVSQMLGLYCVAGGAGGSFVQDERYIEQYYQLPQQKAALNNWLTGVEESKKSYGAIPPVSPSMEEREEYAAAITEVNKYKDQMVVKFITGIEPIEKFDEYVEKLNAYGLERAMEIQTNSLNRFYKR